MQQKDGTSFLRGFFIFLNVGALVVLLLSCMATYINPNVFWQLSFIGFAFPVVLLVNVFFLVLWVFKRSRFVFISLAAIMLSWKFIYSSFTIHPASKEEGVKVMTWNVKNFDLYNWSHNQATRSQMMNLIEKEDPDVLCMQEFYTNNQSFKNLETLRDSLGFGYCYFYPSVNTSKLPKTQLQKTLWTSGTLNQQWGVATFSKYPIVDSGRLDFKNSFANDCIYTDVEVNGKAVRVYNVHFQSIQLGQQDYAAIDSVEQKSKVKWTDVKAVVKKMKTAYAKRALQAEAVGAHAGNYSGNKIICGDFNDVPVSYTYETVRQELQDAFVAKGNGFGATFVNKLSIFRIDYVLPSKDIKVNSYRTVRENYSDHYPVCVTLTL